MEDNLAKRLKDAGFECTNAKFYNAEVGLAPDPTFYELIEAVKNHQMNRKDVGLYANYGEYVAWARKTNLDAGDGDRDFRGKTPEEAMALLWLELQGGSAPQLTP